MSNDDRSGLDNTHERKTNSGWWLGHPSEKYEFVNWDDEIPNINGKIKNGNQTTNQNFLAIEMRQHVNSHATMGETLDFSPKD